MKRVRVRFAPSPTGPLHMGGVRTALYNYLFAKKHGGDFILRIEDTDSHRFVPRAEEYIIESLRWCGIMPDEGLDESMRLASVKSERNPHAPYRQSERKSIYRAYAEQLVRDGFAYYAFDTAEELEGKRAAAEGAGETFIYSAATRGGLRNSLTIDASEVASLLESRTDWTIRFKMPADRVVEMDDIIRGHIEVNSSTLDDKVLWKRADELPTYHLANIVDDHLMEISHVIRGEEWLPSLPLHYLLYEAFGWERPQFAHLPLLLKPVGNGKLSKRDGDKMGFPVFPLKWVAPDGAVSRGYREDGYFPDAFVNLLAMLGWNPGTEQEIFSMDELVEAFSLEKVGKSGAKFNPDKAKWFNKEYLRMRSSEELAREFVPVLEAHGVSASFDTVTEVVELIKERATFVADFWDIAWYLFVAPSEYAEKDAAKFFKAENVQMAREAMEKSSSAEAMEEYIRSKEWPMGKVMNCIRLALTGSSSGLGIADIIRFIGWEEALARFQRAEERLF
ncbi:MAG: glutamate--tRNA ligase [Bacteroidales bacterium]|nr:glutamate--tRNA ligase [Bacteroidales bacterium]